MNGNSHNSRNQSTHIQSPARPWRSVFIALVLALAIGSTGQATPAQAAPPAELVYFSMKVLNPKTILRCGQTVTYYVKVELAQSYGAPTPVPGSLGLPKGQSMVNMKVEAFSVDKKVGDFVSTEKGSATGYTMLVFDDELTGLAAKFKFKANKPGKTTLYFEGLAGKEYVSDKVEVEVLPCDYRIKAFGQWNDGESFYWVSAVTDEAVVTADENGQLTGSATVKWTGTLTYMGCKFPVQMASGQVNYSGEVSESAQMTINQTYAPVAASDDYVCGRYSGWSKGLATADPLTISMPASGGVSTLPHVVTLEWALPLSGSITIIVIPVEDEAVAFNADSRSSLFPSAWLKTLWDEFPWFSSVLLALR